MKRESLTRIPSEAEVIEIQITARGLGYANKTNVPIPELTFGEVFTLRVTAEDGVEGSLAFSNFRIVAFDPAGRTIWPHDDYYELKLQEADGRSLGSVSLDFSGGQSVDRSLILERVEVKAIVPRSTPRPQLIFFDMRVTIQGRTFELDPPWVGKPPVG